jgi:hypothetical protein
MLLAAAVLFLGGCDKFISTASSRQKKAAAESVSSLAQAKFAARLAQKSVGDKAGRVGDTLAALLCSSPKLVEQIEGDKDLLDALSGEGGDNEELKRQFADSRGRYRAMLERQLPARGIAFTDFAAYSAGRENPGQKAAFKAVLVKKCPGGDQALLEKSADDLMYYFAKPLPGGEAAGGGS